MPSKIYSASETASVWGESGGSGVTKLLDLGGLATVTVACGAYLDLGATSRCDLYEVEVYIDGFAASSVVLGTTIDCYIIQSNDGTNFDGSPTTAPTSSAQGTVTLDQARNAYYVGSVACTTTGSTQTLRARFVVRLTGRYIAPVISNRTAQSLKSSSDNHRVTITPIPYESQ